MDVATECPWFPAAGPTVQVNVEVVPAPYVAEPTGPGAPTRLWSIDTGQQFFPLPGEVAALLPPLAPGLHTLESTVVDDAVRRAAKRSAAPR